MTLIMVGDIFLQTYFRGLEVGVANGGISFGLFPNLGGLTSISIYLIFMVWFFAMVWKGKFRLSLMALAFGGLGNLLPRLWLGSVWDYIYFPVLGFWFNLADVLIVFGVFSYILGGDGNSDSLRRRGDAGNK